jgi:hypothetical protein
VHDSQKLEDVLDMSNTASDVWADSAYRSNEVEAKLAERGLKSRIHRRAYRNREGIDMSFLPFVSLFANMNDVRDLHMPPFCATAIGEIAVQKLRFRAEMILSDCFAVGLEFLARNHVSGLSVERAAACFADIFVKWRDGFCLMVLAPAAFFSQWRIPPPLTSRAQADFGRPQGN